MPASQQKAKGHGRNGRPIRGLKTGQRKVGQLVHGLSALEQVLRDGLSKLDGRLGLVKRAHAQAQAWTHSHLAGEVSLTEQTAVDRIVPLTLMATGWERRFLRTGEEPTERYFTVINALHRWLAVLPTERRAREVDDVVTQARRLAAEQEARWAKERREADGED